VSTSDQVRAEEREAREQQRHMERMAREAQRIRDREAAAARRARATELRGQLFHAIAGERVAAREYSRALTAYERCSDRREAELGRALDVAYARSMQASQLVRELREELGS
jgi:hypothetical protein